MRPSRNIARTVPSNETGKRPRLAIVGTGIAGLVAAHRLQHDFDLTIFEANGYVGGHTNTVETRGDDERPVAIDTGFIVFNDLNYPGFTSLLDELGVASHATTMSFSVRCEHSGLEYNGTSLRHMFAQRRNLVRPSFYGMIRDILRFNREGRRFLANDDDTTTVAEFVEAGGYGAAFIKHYLLPMGSALWSCPRDRFGAFPLRFVVEFLDNHRMLQIEGRPTWRVVTGGSRRYVDALIRPFADRVHLQMPVRRVRREQNAVVLEFANRRPESFDHVVLASHADQSLRMLEHPTATEQKLLAAFPYQRNHAILHTDTSVLPRAPLARAAWNYRIPADRSDDVTVTYDMNMLQGLTQSKRFCVTLNGERAIDPQHVIAAFDYAHPLFAPGRRAAQSQHDQLIDHDCVSYCGAYWGYGFHEDGVQSALRVSQRLAKRSAT